MKVYVNMLMKSTRTHHLHQLLSLFIETGLKRKVSVSNKFPSKLERWKRDDDIVSMDFSPKKWSIVPWAVCSIHIVIVNIATSVWLLKDFGVIYETNTAFIRTSPCNSSNNSPNLFFFTETFRSFFSLRHFGHLRHSSIETRRKTIH